ncbi:MAG TPA: diguanylate cyclase [Candidatus Xenobia bacterium]|jgi:diguanylate cyclase (GGDEF)-like protein
MIKATEEEATMNDTLQGRILLVGAPDLAPLLMNMGLDPQVGDAEDVDGIVMDLETPGAFDRLGALKDHPTRRALPILAVVRPEQASQAIEAGANDCIEQPVTAPLLWARLRNMLGRQQLTRRARQLEQTVADLQEELGHRTRELQRMHRVLLETAFIDALTHLPNRRATLSALRQTWALSSRQKLPLSFLMVDIDKFKDFNDTWGHSFGDRVLAATADRIRQCIRLSDLVGRWGGEEFLVICPDTNLADAAVCAERIRAGVAALRLEHDGATANVTVSVGVAAVGRPLGSDPLELVRAADTAMYAAKQAGRNCVRSV